MQAFCESLRGWNHSAINGSSLPKMDSKLYSMEDARIVTFLK